ncbi:MAG: hypothetical protein P8129_17225 [Anaerolineae bacterium]
MAVGLPGTYPAQEFVHVEPEIGPGIDAHRLAVDHEPFIHQRLAQQGQVAPQDGTGAAGFQLGPEQSQQAIAADGAVGGLPGGHGYVGHQGHDLARIEL